MKVAGYDKRDDAIANDGALDELDWTNFRVVVAVGGKIATTETVGTTLKVSIDAATEGHDRKYHAKVVESNASDVEWEVPASAGGHFEGVVMQRPVDMVMQMPSEGMMQMPSEGALPE